jgi:hypothetical protein
MRRPHASKRTARLSALALALLCVTAGLVHAARSARSAPAAETHSFKVIPLANKDVVVDKTTQTLYVSVPSSAGAGGNSITPFNPYTGAAGTPVFVGSEPGDLAISDDGKVIWAALDGAKAVRRFDVATQTAGLQFSLGTDQFGGAYAARQLKVAPGAPETVAVQSGGSQFDSKLFVFDSGVRRGSPLPSAADYLDFSATAGTLYVTSTATGVMGGYTVLQRVSLTASGPAYEGSPTNSARRPGEVRYAGGRVYNANGDVFDGATGAVLGTYLVPYFVNFPTLAPDPSAGRVFYVSNDQQDAFGNQTVTLHVFDLSTFQEVGTVLVPGASGQPTGLERWGSDGLVFRTPSQLVIVRSTLVGPPGTDPTPTPTPGSTPTPTPTPTQYPDVVRRINLFANDLVVEPNTQTIYASVPSRAGAGGNSLTPVNPFEGTAGTPVFVGSEPGPLAVSDDGSYIYVGLTGAGAVRRFDVAARAADIQFQVAKDHPDGPLYVRDLAVMPGSPRTVAVSRRASGGFSPDYRGVAVYDDGVPRAKVEGNYPGSYGIEFSDSPTLIYGMGDTGLHRLSVDASGVTRASTTQTSISAFKFAAGRIYTSTGQVIDPANGAVVGAYNDPGRAFSTFVLPDPASKRTYFISDNGLYNGSENATATIRAFDQQTFLPVGSLNVSGLTGAVTAFVRWGARGLAFSAGGQLYLIETPLVPSSGPAPTTTPSAQPTPTPTPAATPAPGELRLVNVPARDIVLDPKTQTIYASAGPDAAAAGYVDSVVPIDPLTGTVGPQTSMGGRGRMAISDDSQFIYVALNTTDVNAVSQFIGRFDVKAGTAGPQFKVNQTPNSTTGYLAQDIAVMPGRPDVIAVARSSFSSGGAEPGGVALYDHGVQRPAVAAGGTAVEFSPSPAVLYSYHGLQSDPGFRKMVVGDCGIATASVATRVTGGDIKYDNGRVYSVTTAVDAESAELLGTFTPNTGGDLTDSFYSAFATDSKAGRVYVVGNNPFPPNAGPVLRVYDTETFLQVGALRLPGVQGTPIRALRWGARGLAFVTRADAPSFSGFVYRLYVLENDIVTGPKGQFVPAPLPPTPLLSVKGQVTYFDGLPGVQLNVTGTYTTTAVTDAAGNYTVEGVPHCADINVTPYKENYTFNPPSVHLTDPGGVYRLNFTATPKRVYFPNSVRGVSEGGNFLQVLVRRDGDLTQPASVDYETQDGTASSRSDYTAAYGTLRFEPGESQKTVNLLVTDDVLVEGSETFTLALKNPSGAMFLPQFDKATVIINDNDTTQPTSSPLQDARFFVRRHYQDFLNRDPASDPKGFDFWTSQITDCAAEADPQLRAECTAVRRVNVSAAFFLSIEFQNTGYFVHRLYVTSYPATAARPRGLPRFAEFMRDAQEVGRNVVVGAIDWEQLLEQNKQAFALRWVMRPEFLAAHPETQGAGDYVDSLFQNAGAQPTAQERDAAVAAFGAGGAAGRAAALRAVAEGAAVNARQINRAFVLMQYFGYLRRGPDETPDSDFAGYDFWLGKLEQFNGNYIEAEMVKAFISSLEYQQRFGPTNFDLSK